MILGPTGIGKTCLGYSFLGESCETEPGLLFTFYETAARAKQKAMGIGIDFDGLVASGDLEILWQPPVESSLDAVGNRLLEAVERRKVRRLFIDGFNALEQCAAYPERVPQFFAALAQRLRSRGVTTVYSAELNEIFSPQIVPPTTGLSPLLESLIVMRFAEMHARVRRVVSVLKMRDSDFDSTLREFDITPHGLRMNDGLANAEAVLTGSAHEATGAQRKATKTKTKTAEKGRRSSKSRR
jgi:circadian clock protein KaiC